MNRLSAVLAVAIFFVAGCAGVNEGRLSHVSKGECAERGDGAREACALAVVERACRDDRSRLGEDLAQALEASRSEVQKTFARHRLANLAHGDLCDSGLADRKRLVAAIRRGNDEDEEEEEREERGRAQSAREWLMRELGGPSGVIDFAGVARAVEERSRLVVDSRAKRSGLPALPTGWTNLTGYPQSSGRINHMLALSADGQNLLAGADGGGIWRTTNGGTSWTPVNDLLGSLAIMNFAKSASDANTIYAATSGFGSHTYVPFGVVKSIDGGTTWAQIPATNPASNPDFEYVQRVAVSPTNSQVVLAATKGGAWYSSNGGVTWQKVPHSPATTAAYYVAFHPMDASRFAASYDDGTVVVTTLGDLLAAGYPSTVLPYGRYTRIAYAKSNVAVMYALVTNGGLAGMGDFRTKLFRSADSGNTWTELTTSETTLSSPSIDGFTTFYNGGYLSFTGALWVDPLNENRVAVCEGWCAFTADISVASPTWNTLYSGWTDFHGIVEHPGYDGSANKTVFFMDDGGLYKVSNIDQLNTFGAFTRLEGGLTTTEVYSVSGRAGGNPILGAQDVGPRVYKPDPSIGDATNKWRFIRLSPTDPYCASCQMFGDGMTTAASAANASVLYASRQYLDMFRSNDGGATFSSIVAGSALNEGAGVRPTGNQNAAFNAPFVLDPSNQSRMYAGGQSLWRTDNADTGNPPTWTSIRAPYFDPYCDPYSKSISVIAVAPSNPDIVWTAQACTGRLFMTASATQGLTVWSEVWTFPIPTAKGSILIDRNDPNIVWVGVVTYSGPALYKTTNGGASWSPVSGLPNAPVWSLVQHPASTSWMYAGTAVGLFASDDGGVTWSTTNEGPANVVVKKLDWTTTGSNPDLLAATFGRGVFRATVNYVAPAASTTTLNASLLTANAGTAIAFTATVSGGVGTPTGSVDFRDGTTSLGTVALNGSAQATLSTSALAGGSHSITAVYLGSGTYATSTSAPVTVTITVPNPPRLGNISTRMQVLTGGDVMIGGFIIGGSSSKTVVVRARGPSLIPYGITNALPNPTLTLVRSSDQSLVATNDDWGSATNAAAINASGFAPANALESAILVSLPPGAYTAIVSGVGNTTGVGIVEVFEVDAFDVPLRNISTRGQVLTGNDVMIGGFIVQGTGPQTVVVRARGPSLVPFGIANALMDPTLTLVRSSDQAVLATNNDWGAATNAAAITSSGFAPSDPRESAILITLDPGAYTAIVSGVGGSTGVGIVEVFATP